MPWMKKPWIVFFLLHWRRASPVGVEWKGSFFTWRNRCIAWLRRLGCSWTLGQMWNKASETSLEKSWWVHVFIQRWIQFWFSCDVFCPLQNEHIKLTSSYNLIFWTCARRRAALPSRIVSIVSVLTSDEVKWFFFFVSTWRVPILNMMDIWMISEDRNSISPPQLPPKKFAKFTGIPPSLPPFWSRDSWWVRQQGWYNSSWKGRIQDWWRALRLVWIWAESSVKMWGRIVFFSKERRWM